MRRGMWVATSYCDVAKCPAVHTSFCTERNKADSTPTPGQSSPEEILMKKLQKSFLTEKKQIWVG